MTTTLSRLLLLGASAAALSACTTVDLASLPQPKYATRIEDVVPGGQPAPPPTPVYAAPSEPAPAPPSAEPVPPTVRAAPAPSGRVTSEALPPPAPSAQASSYPADHTPPPPPPPVKGATKPATTVSAPRPATATTGGLRYTVQPGDTLSGVGRRFAVPVRALIDLNGLPAEGGIRSGQKLKLPPEATDRGTDPYASGPVTGEPVRQVAEATAPKPVTPAPTRREPTPVRTDPAPVAVQPAETRPVPPTGKGVKPSTPRAEVSTPVAQAPVPPSGPAAPIIASGPPIDPDAVIASARGRFAWPLKGEILSRYGSMGQGLRNDGINIGASSGAPVKAADAGEVVYAGDSVPGFGNLVLIKHADGWVTAYGHLAKIDVKMRQQVARGAVIGQVGQTGGVDRPQLHFEMRYATSPAEKARPMDPLPLLQ
ncbi:M23 family metallopeptidase [Caulobacter sp. 17J80-11]|uniref:M23 family metallopeptidase n=1 Tax=Caulobacter sp. 17J80-11 TaxID=2763502 RepID=UPI001653D678|nr:M23 family metallopeptidase [Caulobacter sp. 17J80-11]MBC6981757.1 M23 family metallopeptidase [Caulobacter sp. 17J80-11]